MIMIMSLGNRGPLGAHKTSGWTNSAFHCGMLRTLVERCGLTDSRQGARGSFFGIAQSWLIGWFPCRFADRNFCPYAISSLPFGVYSPQ